MTSVAYVSFTFFQSKTLASYLVEDKMVDELEALKVSIGKVKER